VGHSGRGGWIVRRRKASAVRRSGRQRDGSGGFVRLGREARSQDRVAYGRDGRHGLNARFPWVLGDMAARRGSPPLQGFVGAFQAVVGHCKGSPDGSVRGAKALEASGSCPARAREASDLGPARLTPLLFSAGFRGPAGSENPIRVPKTMMPTEARHPRRHPSASHSISSRPSRPDGQKHRYLGSSATLVLKVRSSTPDESCVTRGGSPANHILGLRRFLAQNLGFSRGRRATAVSRRGAGAEAPTPASLAENRQKSRPGVAPCAVIYGRRWPRPEPGSAGRCRRAAARRTCRRPPARPAPRPPPWRGPR